MKKNHLIKLTILLPIIFAIISCNEEKKVNEQTEKITKQNQDTIIVKHKNILNESYEVGFYSKSYSYYWLVGKDSLDFILIATENEKDSTLSLNIYHKEPILFTIALLKINECYPLIKEDFYLTKLNSLYFRDPIYYPDLAKELSMEYAKQFGSKNIGYEKRNQFILNSELNKQLDQFVNPLDKKVTGYGIEKFHLTEKKYLENYLPNVDMTAYPEYIINGMGLYVQLGNKLKK